MKLFDLCFILLVNKDVDIDIAVKINNIVIIELIISY